MQPTFKRYLGYLFAPNTLIVWLIIAAIELIFTALDPQGPANGPWPLLVVVAGFFWAVRAFFYHRLARPKFSLALRASLHSELAVWAGILGLL